MISTIVGALLPIVVTLLLGFAAGWHHDFDAKQATVLNRMVMLYALPLSLFGSMIGSSRDGILAEGPLALIILVGMAGAYAVVFVVCRMLLRNDLATAGLRAIAISGPAVPFVGTSVLGQLFGAESAVPISVSGLAMNLIQVPATLMLLSAAQSGADTTRNAPPPTVWHHVVHALREPVVWAPLLAFVLVLANLHFPAPVRQSLLLLGSATGGVALFASGIVLHAQNVAVNFPVILSVVSRNIAIPAIMWAALLALGVAGPAMKEGVITLAIPTASICVILAVQYHTAEQEMASMLFFSTIFSVVTMGGFIWLTA